MSQFTVIIPTFNRGRLVSRAIDSALQQTVKPARIIVVDDGSTDDTPAVCAKYGAAIDYVRQENGGVSTARNHGIRLSQTPWTAFLDSDDYWKPTHLERIAAAIRATDGQARFYFTDMQLPGSGDQTIWTHFGFKFNDPHLLKRDGTDWVLAEREPCCIQCSVFSTGILKLSGGFDPRFRVTEDRELFCRLGIGHSICAVSGVGCVQTADDHPNNRLGGIVNGGSENFWKLEMLLWTSLLARFPHLKNPHRRALLFNLACAHWRLSRLHWRLGKPVKSFKNIVRSAQAQPAFLLWLIRHRNSGGWQPTVFAPLQVSN